MKIFTLKRKQILKTDIKTAWRFFSDPVNLALITPPWLNFRIVSELPKEIYSGLIIRYKVKPLFGIPLNWVSEITHSKEPYYFVDEQRSGPYKFWHHQHHLKETDEGIEVEDIVNYALPVMGTLLNNLIVKNKLTGIFNFREEYLDNKFNKY